MKGTIYGTRLPRGTLSEKKSGTTGVADDDDDDDNGK